MKRIMCIVISFALLLSNCIISSASTIHNPVKGDVSIWDCVWFGEYPQSKLNINIKHTTWKWERNAGINGYCFNKDNNKVFFPNNDGGYYKYEPIKWRVLEIRGNEALVIADKVLDNTFYHEGSFFDGGVYYKGKDDLIWSKSYIRGYLKYMKESMFSVKEDNAVQFSEHKTDYISEIIYPEDIIHGHITYITSTETTQDELFLMSYDEMTNEKYGFDKNNNKTTASSFTGLSKIRKHGYSDLFIPKNPGYYIRIKGTVLPEEWRITWGGFKADVQGNITDHNSSLYIDGVRPAMWIDLSKANYQYAGTVKSDGTGTEILFSLAKSKVIKAIKSSKKSRKLKVKLKAVNYADGQQVKVYTTKKKAKSNKKAIFNKKTTKINNKFKSKKFKNKKKLYVRARGYVKKNGKTKYGAWSKIKKVKKK